MMKILWLAPNFNHYKARFLNHLAKEKAIELTILSGTGRKNMGDGEIKQNWEFEEVKLSVSKKDFGKSKVVRQFLKKHFNQFDWILIPAEKKNLMLFLYAISLKKKSAGTKLFSYNHPILKSGNGRITFLDKWLTRFYFKKLDRVIFYTKESYKWALENNFIKKDKAFWANNTIDTDEISKYSSFSLPPQDPKTIVFIGRLISSKRVDLLITYFETLQEKLPNLNLSLEVIGDGPDMSILKQACKQNKGIICHGTLTDEQEIAPIMQRASFVFVPGHSGLSVNHAFSYGRPYITLQGPSHAPEVDYIDNNENGYILDGDFEDNINVICDLLNDQDKLQSFCGKANETGKQLSVHNWVNQIKTSLMHD